MMGMLKEFKEFAMKGNLVDMAVAFVMGAAFGKIVSAFINGMVMPIVGVLTTGIDFKDLKIVLAEAQLDAAGKVIKPEAALMYGDFITVFIDFVIVAFVMFLVVKAMIKAKKKQEEVPAAPPAPTKEQELLSEIRDLLKK
ncbi:MAG TPA: large-conductance mechanosensitive channel protein MscL [Bacteroidales bacterium]|nr:large-conductance mechanosensitive channel protein MscL [Bacteroidales bacterium]HPS71654.1 large-conductance mechanosensitive channel protein MscL [Bacteroidales bacterium]